MQDLNDLYYFVQIVNYRGFASAGRALGIPKSKLSRRLAMLEERLNVRLIERSTRHFTVSEIGKTYYQHCLAVLIEAEAAQASVEEVTAEPRGKIRITCPVMVLQAHIASMLAEFMAMHPLLTVVLEATSRKVDVIDEGVDLAIFVLPPPLEDSNLVMRTLADCGQSLVASPKLIQQYGGLPTVPSALNAFPTISRIGSQSSNWVLYGKKGEQAVIKHTPRFITSDMVALREAALSAVGIVQLPLMAISKQLAEGTLIKVLPEWQPHRELVHVIYSSKRGLLPSVRLLIDFLVQRFAKLDADL